MMGQTSAACVATLAMTAVPRVAAGTVKVAGCPSMSSVLGAAEASFAVALGMESFTGAGQALPAAQSTWTSLSPGLLADYREFAYKQPMW